MNNNRRLWMQVTVAGLTSLSLGLGTLTPAHAQDFSAPPTTSDGQDAAPSNGPKLTGVLAEARLITAEWTLAPAEFGATYYQIQLVEVKNGAPTDKLVKDEFGPANATRHQFTNVPPGDYVVRVAAGRGVENSDFSQSEILTISDKPQAPQAPHKPYLQLKSNKTVRVEWDRRSSGSTRIHTYLVELQPSDNSEPRVEKVTDTNTFPNNFVEFSGLKENVSYTATVEAESSTGKSRASETSDAITVTADPAPKFELDTDTIDLAKGGEFTITGSGYTGAAAKEGVYVVFWATSKWKPGELPLNNGKSGVSVLVPPAEITDGTFTK